uniref:NADH-ubiquinone oxidoreductase chain 4L n=1 Tax=Elateroidea sp. 8 KM-2017 TaxID=2219431 RepID=A0A346RHG0_9COLE|nr:NADH dehydrogenase subunit 4L [Elateroidea sp. 8 KM-2017]
MFMYMYMYICGLIIYSFKSFNFLFMLMGLEFIVLSLYIMLLFYLSMFDYELFFSMVFLIFSVCEGSLGLSILVMIVRSHGSDYLQFINLLW